MGTTQIPITDVQIGDSAGIHDVVLRLDFDDLQLPGDDEVHGTVPGGWTLTAAAARWSVPDHAAVLVRVAMLRNNETVMFTGTGRITSATGSADQPTTVEIRGDQPLVEESAHADDIATWLRQQLDHVERTALAAQDVGTGNWRIVHNWHRGAVQDVRTGCMIVYDEGMPTVAQAEHIALHDPVRELAMVAAIRVVLDEIYAYEGSLHLALGVGPQPPDSTVAALQHLALPFADRPGYREEWRP